MEISLYSVKINALSPVTKDNIELILEPAKMVRVTWKDHSHVIFIQTEEGDFLPDIGDFGFHSDFFIKPKPYDRESFKEILRFCKLYVVEYDSDKPVSLPEGFEILERKITDYDKLIDILHKADMLQVEDSPSQFKLHERRFKINDPPQHLVNYGWIDIDFIGTKMGEDILEHLKFLHREINIGNGVRVSPED